MIFKSILSVALLFVIRVNGQIADKCDLTARPQCSSDCTKILACVSRIETPIFTVNCTGSTPYCANGHCVATSAKCASRTKPLKVPFLCTSSGIFPDPTDCSMSHSCAEVGAESIMSICPKGTIFDSKLKLCVPTPSKHESVCQSISCDGVTNNFISFPANPTFYAYCFTSATGVDHTYLYKCDDEVNKVFDVKTKKCRFRCKSSGYYADPFDCSSYYICNRGLKFASRHVHCPPNYYFNGTVCLNSKAHCPIGSIVNATSATMSPITNTNSMIDEMSMIPHPTTEEVMTDATKVPITSSNSVINEISTMIHPTTEEVTTDGTKVPITSSNSVTNEMSTMTLPTTEAVTTDGTKMPISSSNSVVDEMTQPTTEQVATDTTKVPITTTATSTISTTTTTTRNSMADEISATSHPTTEEVLTDATTLSFSSIMETSTTRKPTTQQSSGLEIDLTTKKPSIWKHMGLISVRVGRLLNMS